MIALMILGYLLLFIFAMFFLAILIPIDYRLEASKYSDINFLGSLSLYNGMLRLQISMMNFHSSKIVLKFIGLSYSFNVDMNNGENTLIEKITKHTTKENIKKDPKQKTSIKKDKKSEGFLKYFNKELLAYCLNFIKDIWHNIKPKKLEIKAIYGFDDPYNTAMVSAFISTLYPLLKEYPVHLTPSFDESTFEGEFKIKGKISIILLLYMIIRFVVTNPIRSIIKNTIKKNKEEKSYAN